MYTSPTIIAGLSFGIVSMICYGIYDFISAPLARKSGAVAVAFWYFLLAWIIFSVIGLIFFRIPKFSLFDIGVFSIASVVSAFSLVTFYKGLETGSVSVVVPIANAWSVVVILVGVLFLAERIGSPQIVGIVAVVAGTVVISRPSAINKRSNRLARGTGYAVATMFEWGVFFSIVGILSKQFGWIWPVLITSMGSAIVIFIYMIVARIRLDVKTLPAKTFLFYILVGTLAFAAYSIGAERSYVSVVSPVAASSPIVALLLARVFLKERVDVVRAFGIFLVLVGIIGIAL